MTDEILISNCRTVRETLIASQNTDFTASDMNRLCLQSRAQLTELADEAGIEYETGEFSGWENKAGTILANQESDRSESKDEEDDLSGWENKATTRIENEQ